MLLSDDGKPVETTAWQMIEAASDEVPDKGGPCKLPASHSSSGATEDKYLSMNTVDVNLCGNDSKLFVVRDMTTLVGLQSMNYSKQLFSCFTEKILLQIQETTLGMIEHL